MDNLKNMTNDDLEALYIAARQELRHRNRLGLEAATKGENLDAWISNEEAVIGDSTALEVVQVAWDGYTGTEIDQEVTQWLEYLND